MALTVNPGSLPADGSRINPENILDTFIQGTTISGFGPPEFSGTGKVNFVISQTEAPDASVLKHGVLWFKRGEGRMYMYDDSEAALGLWVAISDRKEMIVRLQSGPAAEGSVVWMDTAANQEGASEFPGKLLGQNRVILKVQATESAPGVSDSFRSNPTPPFLVIPEIVSASTFNVTEPDAGVYTTAVEMGYVNARVYEHDVSEGPAAGFMGAAPADKAEDALIMRTSYNKLTTMVGSITQSGPPPANKVMMVFLKGTPSNLTGS